MTAILTGGTAECQILVPMKQLTSAFLGNKNHTQVVVATMKTVPDGKPAHPPPCLALWVCWQP